jgi:Flp pilus assembly protein TadG
MLRIFKKRLLKLGRRQEGVAAVEFAIILPVLMLLVLGGMDLGDMYFIQNVITNASREGARYAAKYTGTATLPTSSQISNYVTSDLNYQSLNLNSLNVSASYTGTAPDEIVTVTVKANKYWWILGSFGLADPKTLTAQTAMTVEGP